MHPLSSSSVSLFTHKGFKTFFRAFLGDAAAFFSSDRKRFFDIFFFPAEVFQQKFSSRSFSAKVFTLVQKSPGFCCAVALLIDDFFC